MRRLVLALAALSASLMAMAQQPYPELGAKLDQYLLALAGDAGGSLGPSLVGRVSGLTGDNLKLGLLAAIIFPAVMIIGLLVLRGKNSRMKE